jgi:hypothetical protein
MRSARNERRAAAWALIGALVLAPSCKKKDEQPEEAPMPPKNAATLDVVRTEIGTGLAMRADLAPTNVTWQRVVVLSDDRAVLLGRDRDTGFALVTSDRGRTWSSLSTPIKAWSGWGVAADGAVVLATGQREQPKAAPAKLRPGATPKPEPIIDAAAWFAGADARQMDGPRILFPDDGKLKGVTVPGGMAAPALLEGLVASLLVGMPKGKSQLLAYAAASGNTTPAPTALDKGTFVPVPYGRPPRLIAVNGGAVTLYNWPKPGEPLGLGAQLPGFAADATAFDQLTDGPSCEAGAFSYRRFAGPSPQLLGISGDRALAIRLPAGEQARIGCSTDAVVVETTTLDPGDAEKKRKVPQLVRCQMDGKCAEPKSPPFAIWTEKHERDIWAVPTGKGIVAVMRARAGARWALYLGQSNDGGSTFELPRTIAEGKSDRGAIELGALVRFRDRVVMLITADVGTSARRGWYALASDDGGDNWGPP